ncbi:MAG: helix-turn-helix domain-containing protein [Desulfomonile sp.]|nr:helix-turn-helix domain-containing protein [Desulfomonile sp.]
MSTFYSYTAVARQLDLNPAKLKRWLDFGHFKTRHTALLGDTEARLFTESDIAQLKRAVDFIEYGYGLAEAFSLAREAKEEKDR